MRALVLERVAFHRQAAVTGHLALEVAPCLACVALTTLDVRSQSYRARCARQLKSYLLRFLKIMSTFLFLNKSIQFKGNIRI